MKFHKLFMEVMNKKFFFGEKEFVEWKDFVETWCKVKNDELPNNKYNR